MKHGIIYFNTGTSCAVRLLVSLHSLRRYYDGPVTILSEGQESHDLCEKIAKHSAAELKVWDCCVPEGANRVFLAKTRYHDGTPYDTTIALDSDTLVCGEIDELFGEAESHGFCVAQFSNWRTDGGIVAKRIARWRPWLPDDIRPALEFGPAINCGVVAFQKSTLLYQDWMRLALPGRESFIPDEVCCQVVLHRYPHRIIDSRWNRSCRYDRPSNLGTRVIHFHGRKHCREGLPFHGHIWVKAFAEVWKQNLAEIRDWMPATDGMLGQFMNSVSRAAWIEP